MRTARILFLTLFLAISGCGTGEGDTLVFPDLAGVPFAFGQQEVDFYGNRLDFGALGAADDGRIACLEDVNLDDYKGMSFGEIFALAFDSVAEALDVHVAFDMTDCVDRIVVNQWGRQVKLLAPVEEDESGLLAPGTNTRFHVGRSTTHVEALLAAPKRFGPADTGFRLTIGADFNGTGWDVDVTADRNPGAPATADEIQVRQNGQVLATLPALDEGTAQASVLFTIDGPRLVQPIQVRFIAGIDSFFGDVDVDFETDLSPPDLEVVQTRAYDLPYAGEAVFSESRAMFARTHPMLPQTALEEFALVVYGEGFVEALSKPLPEPLQQTDSGASPAPGTTYDGGTIGVVGNSGYPSRKPSYVTDPPVVAARIMVGSWGISIANFDNTLMTFEAPSLAEAGNMTDYAPFDGDPESGLGVYCDNTLDAIKFIARDANDEYVLAPAATITSAAYPGASGKVVSAFRHDSGDLLFVTDGDPGELWVLPAGVTTATKVDAVFAAPRRVRAAGNIAAVTCFGGAASFGGLKVFVRSAAGTWSAAPFGLLGTRSVGCDIKVLPDGRVAIAYTNFADDTARIAVVEADGQFSFSQDFFLPGGVTGPGHCAFCKGTTNGLWVTANTSRHVVLLPVFFSPP